ncbi:Cof-type HAD-IIB family hydrolase [Neobacillus cucumis]|uniref:Cof-type HAD-IIB family hydrolase n=1 Tax=Neobacillus cucumis TaxID=1740721 RepID=UPI0019647098|nr:Cof-type HAD-IIB family hydrolase [Neobacillus cucumis]MBM7654393.1 Cof subfamily protein (haloacid dehalogenase superfamily) [Neobacillus cucumis]
MQTKQLIFFDIDGTLLNEEKQLPASAKMAINRLQELGHEIAIATGRAPFMFKDLREELGIHSYVSFNGQYVVHNGKPVYRNPLDPDELHLLTASAGNKLNPIIYENHEKMYSSVESHPHVEEGIGSLKIKDGYVFDPHFYKGSEIYQSLLFCNDEEQEAYRSQFSKFEFVRWHERSVDVVPAGGSKAIGIEALMNHLTIPKENVYAFGDGLNDVTMLTFVENSIAMGNAVEEVKDVAKYVTKHVDEDGILRGLELVGLL